MAATEASDGVEFIESVDLFNMLQQGIDYSCLSDTNYLYLIDARKKADYNESHIITAKLAPRKEDGTFLIPYDAEIECKKNIIVYDGNTGEIIGPSEAIDCALLFWKVGSRGTIKILRGGYEEFSALYPFLRTQKILYTPRELDEIKTYPLEILPGLLYLGNWRQGNSPQVQKDMKIRGHINCCVEAETMFTEPNPHLLHIQVNDDNEEDLYSHFNAACAFTDYHFDELFAVLVFDTIGISRAVTVVIAVIMYTNKWTLSEAYKHVKKCCSAMRPNRGFVEQLSQWEEDILGKKRTDIADPNF
ncbi:unnamed protein product [Candidula unifasciata]|uniref:Serine/threonine/tyrosine-interacting-like protein 1 n=1 Tax=Candidula unifasciata TaxID=100452 RepID=A0A8S4A1M3_9EUPU|nr:unnamed protein product [Candidula unifasciata]